MFLFCQDVKVFNYEYHHHPQPKSTGPAKAKKPRPPRISLASTQCDTMSPGETLLAKVRSRLSGAETGAASTNNNSTHSHKIDKGRLSFGKNSKPKQSLLTGLGSTSINLFGRGLGARPVISSQTCSEGDSWDEVEFRYEQSTLVQPLIAGGFVVVRAISLPPDQVEYLAMEPHSGALVSLKAISPANRQAATEEAQMYARVGSHHLVAQLYRTFQESDHIFFVRQPHTGIRPTTQDIPEIRQAMSQALSDLQEKNVYFHKLTPDDIGFYSGVWKVKTLAHTRGAASSNSEHLLHQLLDLIRNQK